MNLFYNSLYSLPIPCRRRPLQRRGDRRRHLRHQRGRAPEPAGRALRDPGEGPAPRRDLVGERVPGVRVRRRQPPLQLLLLPESVVGGKQRHMNDARGSRDFNKDRWHLKNINCNASST